MTHHKLIVRPGAEHDLEKVNDIYNQYVKDTHFTKQGRYWDVAWFEKPIGGEPRD